MALTAFSLGGTLMAMPATAMAQTVQTSKSETSKPAPDKPDANAATTSSSPPPPVTPQTSPNTNSDTPTQTSEDFVQQTWLPGQYDPRLELNDRLNRATYVAPPRSETIFPSTSSDGSIAPDLSTFKGVNTMSGLVSQVNAFYGSKNPGVDAVAQAMGAKYGSQNYTSGTGGAIPADTNAFDVFNKGGGVCVQIHEGIAAFRAAHGQEAYVVASSAVGNAHTFTIFKENGTWNIQNYGTVVKTNATTLQQLFATAMPEEVRPLLYKVEPDGKVERVASNFINPTGEEQRQFTDQTGIFGYDPFYDRGTGMKFTNGMLSMYHNGVDVSSDVTGQRFGAAYYYKLNLSNPQNQTIEGFGLQADTSTNTYDLKWEHENRWLTNDSFGRMRYSFFGGVDMGVPSPQYWGPVQNYKIGQLGAEVDRFSATLHGQGPVRLETSYDFNLRAVWSYGLDHNTQQAYISGLNGTNMPYLGDGNRMLGDANGSAGYSTGLYYKPDKSFTLRAGVRMGVNLANFDSLTSPATDFRDILAPSVYTDVAYQKAGFSLHAQGDVPILQPDTFRVSAAAAYSPNNKCSIGVNFSHQQVIDEGTDQIGGGVGCKLGDGIMAHVSTTAVIQEQGGPVGWSTTAGLGLNF